MARDNRKAKKKKLCLKACEKFQSWRGMGFFFFFFCTVHLALKHFTLTVVILPSIFW